MEKAASVFLYLAGISFLSVGIYLLHKASRTGGIPERYLGLAFLCNGISYGFSEVPFVFGVEHLVDEMSFIGRIFAAGCTISIAVFTYRVFRPTARWAVRLVWIDAAAIVCGLAVSAFEGDWGGLAPLILYGGGLKMGQVIGQSNRDASRPATEPIRIDRLVSTIMHSLLDVGEARTVTGLPKDVLKTVTASSPIPGLL